MLTAATLSSVTTAFCMYNIRPRLHDVGWDLLSFGYPFTRCQYHASKKDVKTQYGIATPVRFHAGV